jgi:hypothetical protein
VVGGFGLPENSGGVQAYYATPATGTKEEDVARSVRGKVNWSIHGRCLGIPIKLSRSVVHDYLLSLHECTCHGQRTSTS